MRHFLEHITPQVGRRSSLLGAVATGLAATLGRPGSSAADPGAQPLWEPGLAPLPAPKPIPGGLDLPPLIHEFLPGPETITLPFTPSFSAAA